MGNAIDRALAAGLATARDVLSDTTVSIVREGVYDPSTGTEGSETTYSGIRAIVADYDLRDVSPEIGILAEDRRVIITDADLPSVMQGSGPSAELDTIEFAGGETPAIIRVRKLGLNDAAGWEVQVR